MLVVLGHIGLLVVITVAARRDQKFEPNGRQAIRKFELKWKAKSDARTSGSRVRLRFARIIIALSSSTAIRRSRKPPNGRF